MNSKQSSNIYVLYHSPCNDGFGAALSAYKKFGTSAKYIPVSYGQPLPKLENPKEVYILDFSYPKEVLIELSKITRVVVLDHHITAQDQLSGLEFATFDLRRSGAGMSWDYFHPGGVRPKLINLIEDRDLWANKYSDSKAAYTGMLLMGEDFMKGLEAINNDSKADELISVGKVALTYQERIISEIAKSAKLKTFLEFEKVLVCNCPPSLVTDLGDRLLSENPGASFCAFWNETPSGEIKWSLRSTNSKENVAAICERFGGGGHRNAAGFIHKGGLNLPYLR